MAHGAEGGVVNEKFIDPFCQFLFHLPLSFKDQTIPDHFFSIVVLFFFLLFFFLKGNRKFRK